MHAGQGVAFRNAVVPHYSYDGPVGGVAWERTASWISFPGSRAGFFSAIPSSNDHFMAMTVCQEVRCQSNWSRATIKMSITNGDRLAGWGKALVGLISVSGRIA